MVIGRELASNEFESGMFLMLFEFYEQIEESQVQNKESKCDWKRLISNEVWWNKVEQQENMSERVSIACNIGNLYD